MPPVTARPASTVLVVRPGGGRGLEVLMVERPSGGFFGGLMVFPGGAVEACDYRDDNRFTDTEFRNAGLRETAEEVGFVLTKDGFAPSMPLRGAALIDSWDDADFEPGIERMILVSRWVTPEPAPKRFDTRFYLVALDGDPDIVLDETELLSHVWVDPTSALEEASSGRWRLILPTVSHLRWLGRRTSVEDALAAAAGADGSTVIEPVEVDGNMLVRYRGES